MIPLARVAHSLPGRKRVKIDEKRGDETYFIELKKELADCPDILKVEANALAGTVLVHHRADAPDVLRCALERGLFRLDKHPPSTHPLTPAAVQLSAYRKIAKRKTNSRSSNGLNMRFLVFLGMLGVGIVQTIEGNIAIPAIAAFWYAFSTLPRGNDSDTESSLHNLSDAESPWKS
jgi:hypothetical protein